MVGAVGWQCIQSSSARRKRKLERSLCGRANEVSEAYISYNPNGPLMMKCTDALIFEGKGRFITKYKM